MNKAIRFIPLILVIILGVVLYRGLSLNPQEMPSALVGKPMPDFTLTTLLDENKVVTKADLKGDIVLINVWATWCVYCKYEFPDLIDIVKKEGIILYGVNSKDERPMAKQWIEKLGNPYIFSIFDEEGSLGLDMGVYGAPETFVVDHHGIIRKRFAGVINPETWRTEFKPLLSQLKEELKQERLAKKGKA